MISSAETEARTKEAISSLEIELERTRISSDHACARAQAMETYMTLLLNINRDLCDAVHAR